ncbi:hypothetical protein [Bacillus wiedmannii]|uniref:hypothetical protein n=1 Tax=Bacillus wiedmannii TaxID=1890302 RepID=UPI003F8E0131
MKVIIFMFVAVTFFVLGILYMLVLFISKRPKISTWFETFGYCLLAVSLGWSIVFNMTADMANESDKSVVNEKLDLLRMYNGNMVNYFTLKDSQWLSEQYSTLTDTWRQIEPRSENLKKQEELVKKINSALFVLSSILIACGRGGELIEKYSHNKNVEKKYRRRKRRQEGKVDIRRRKAKMRNIEKRFKR